MADQVKAPPVKKSAKTPFGIAKKPDVIIFQLVEQNDTTMRPDTEPFPPYHRFKNTDIITWNFAKDGEEDNWGERAIRWLPGFKSIFVDVQEEGGREIPELVLENPSNNFEIVKGQIKVRPHEATKLQFLRLCNKNVNSEHKTGRVKGLFIEYSEEKTIEALSNKQEQQQEAIDKAFSATDEQIAFHAKYLGVPMIDAATSSSRTLKAVKTDYRQMAINDPVRFLKTFDDEDLRVKHFIQKAIDDNLINLTMLPGKILWTGSKEEICEVAAGSSAVESLFNFCQLKAGEDTLKRIKEHSK